MHEQGSQNTIIAGPAQLFCSPWRRPWPAPRIWPLNRPRSTNRSTSASTRPGNFWWRPYFVAANITGTSQVGRLPNADIDIGTDDILENLRFGGMIRSEVIYQQKVGAMLDVAYMNLGTATDTPRGGGRIRVGVSQLILEGMGFLPGLCHAADLHRCLCRWPLLGHRSRSRCHRHLCGQFQHQPRRQLDRSGHRCSRLS